MKKGFGLVSIIVVVGLLIMVGVGITAAYVISSNNSRKFDSSAKQAQKNQNLTSDQLGQLGQKETNNSQSSDEPLPTATPSSVPSSASTSAPFTYSQPEGLYKINLPQSWVVNSTFATKTYSTTKFVGPIGSISITFGAGKDPIGGCSDSNAVTLADRIIPGCLLLQKDGTRILTRAYTKDKAGLLITIEAFINAPLPINEPEVLSVIKTIDIN